MIKKLKSLNLNQKILLTFIILIFVQIFSQIPLYGINRELLSEQLNSTGLSTLSIFTVLSGSSFANLSIFALGVSPYISASIIIQLLRVAIPALENRCREAKSEKDFIERITFILGIVFALVQAIPLVFYIKTMGLLIENTFFYYFIVWLGIFIGSLIVMGLGKFIDKFGLGKGISLILLMNILTSLKTDILHIYNSFIVGQSYGTIAVTIIISALIIFFSLYIVINMQEGKCDFPVTNSTNLNKGRYGANRSNFTLKVSMSGVMPVIFAMTVLQIYPMVIGLLGYSEGSTLYEISKYLNQSYWCNPSDIKYTLGCILYIGLIFFFSYFYNSISYNTYEISENLSKQGTTLNGIRAGKPTKEFLDKQISSIGLVGSFMLIIVSLIPIVIGGLVGMNLAMGGTSIIIIVGVFIETYIAYKSEKAYSFSQYQGSKVSKGGLF